MWSNNIMWLPYVVMREMWLMSVRDLAEFKIERGDWNWSHYHEAGSAIPQMAGF